MAATWPKEVLERRTEILRQLAGQEKAKIDNFGHGVGAIEQGTGWDKTFSSRLAEIRNVVPVQWTRKIKQYFETKRNQTLRESEAAIMTSIGKTENQEQLKSTILTYLPLERDRSSSVGKEILAFAVAQQAAIVKADALGVTVKQAIADTNRSGKGPPTDGDIYDALMMQIAGYNQYAKSSVDKCNRAVRNNGSLNVLEVAPCLMFGAGQDKILQGDNIVAPQYRVSYFRHAKPCTLAANDNGWMCDYAYRLEGNIAMDAINKLMATGMQNTSRFVWDNGRWLRQ